MPTPAEILSAAMGLTLDERAEVARKLLLSLEPGDLDEDACQAWAAEIKRRLHSIRAGGVRARDWDHALSDIRQALGGRTSP